MAAQARALDEEMEAVAAEEAAEVASALAQVAAAAEALAAADARERADGAAALAARLAAVETDRLRKARALGLRPLRCTTAACVHACVRVMRACETKRALT